MADIILEGAAFHDGSTLYDNAILRVSGDNVSVGAGNTPAIRMKLEGGVVLPGFVDLQVNGGDGIMFNDAPTPQTLARIEAAHRTLGCAAILPTLITDTAAKTEAAIEAAVQATKSRMRGIAGLHLEGPHLAAARKGAHDGTLIRQMEESDLVLLVNAAAKLSNLMITVALESVSLAQIRALSDAGVIVSLGHTDCTFAHAKAAINAGARCVTHLFNAMSQLGSREPGLVGAALSHQIHTGLIADGIHVHPATIASAVRAKVGSGMFLVSDAMALAGSPLDRFDLGGRVVTRKAGRLALPDGTLAGADLTLGRAIHVMTSQVGIGLSDAIKMATSVPAGLLCDPKELGHFSGRLADLVYLDHMTGSCAPLSAVLAGTSTA